MVRKTMLMAAVAMMALPTLASAQAEVIATATVADVMDITGAGNVAFGTLSRTTNNTIDPTSASAAVRTLTYNRNVTVAFQNVPANLTANAGTLQLPVSLTCASRVGAGVWSSATACAGASFDLNVGAALTTATLGFGGTITSADAAAAIAASYSGTFDIVVTAR